MFTSGDLSANQPYQPPANGFRTFLILWVTQTISVMGSALTNFCITIWLTRVLYSQPEQKVQLAAALSIIGVVALVVSFIFGPIAGVWADRHDRRRTMIAANFISSCLSAAMAVLIFTHTFQFWMLILLLSLGIISSVFHTSSFGSSYVMVVSKDQLPRANGMMQTGMALAGVLSPALAAALIALPALARQGIITGTTGVILSRLADGTVIAIGLDAISFFLAAVTLIFLTIPSPKRADLQRDSAGQTKTAWVDLKEGAFFIWSRKPFLWLMSLIALTNLALSFAILMPMLVKYNLAADWSMRGFSYESALAFITSISSAFAVIGGIFVSAWGGLKRRRIYGVIVPLIFSGLALIGFGLSSWLFLTAAMAALFDFLVPCIDSHSESIWQSQTPPEIQGRVFAFRAILAEIVSPFGMVLAGLLGGIINPGIIIAAIGGLLSLFCIVQLFNPILKKVEDTTLNRL